MFENNTYSVHWQPLNGKNRDKMRYRASFGQMIFRKGENMTVFKGRAFSSQDYIPRSIVVRGMRHYRGNVDDFEMYKLCNEKSRMIASQFNKLYSQDSFAVTQIDKKSGGPFSKTFKKEESVVFEDRLNGNFTKYIDKRGNKLERNIDCLILEAFSHYSFVVSEGNFVICGLKGVHRRENSEFILTNPTIHSMEGKFGPKDKRHPGIKDVMENHTCNMFCHRFLDKTSKFDNGSDEC